MEAVEKRVKLSRQRISIARAFLKNAPIILLDEATASLDVDNETVIQELFIDILGVWLAMPISELIVAIMALIYIKKQA